MCSNKQHVITNLKVLRLDEERAAQEKTLAKYSETLQSQKEDNTQLLTDLTALRDVKLTLNRSACISPARWLHAPAKSDDKSQPPLAK